MFIWAGFVDLLQAGLFALAQSFGGNMGMAILVFAFMVRCAMLPLTLYLARRSLAHQAVLRKLKPQLDKLKRRFQDQPDRLAEETVQLFRRKGVSPLPREVFLGGLVQLPVLAGLFAAVKRCAAAGGRFFWIGNIARPDVALTLAVAALTWLAVVVSPSVSHGNRHLLALVPTMLAIVFLWRLATGVALYWAAASGVTFLQAAILRRELPGDSQPV